MMGSEHKEQSMLIRWFRLQHPNIVMYAIPNGGLRNVRVAARLKDEGVLAGVADLHLMAARGGKHGLYIEMKSAKGTLQDNQKLFLDKAIQEGFAAKVCYGFDDAKREIESYLNA